MALTAAEHQELLDVELTDFFQKNIALYKEMAENAYKFEKRAVDAAGLPVRVDDVIQVLLPTLVIEPKLREYLAGKRLTQKYWPKRFGNYVLDRLWKELTDADEEAG